MKTQSQLTAYVSTEFKAAVSARARTERVTASFLIVKALEQYLKARADKTARKRTEKASFAK